MILFFGDLHGKFGHMLRAVEQHRPVAIILLGDIQATRPLEQELVSVLKLAEVWFIHGNHDTDSLADHNNLFESQLADRNLHGRVVEIAGVRVAGLGGVFREDIWMPEPLNAESHYESYADYQQHSEPGRIWAATQNRAARKVAVEHQKPAQMSDEKATGKLLKHRSTIFPQEYYELAAQNADVLVTHEAPSCHPYGFSAIDELARSMRVERSFHGHQHDSLNYQPKWPALGFQAYGVGLRGIADLNGVTIRAGEKDEERTARKNGLQNEDSYIKRLTP